jgi:hypothetical protein
LPVRLVAAAEELVHETVAPAEQEGVLVDCFRARQLGPAVCRRIVCVESLVSLVPPRDRVQPTVAAVGDVGEAT